MLKFEGQNLGQVKAKLVLISSVSLNTTPSMAQDILIASNGFQRVGFLESDHLEPAVGYLNKNICGGSLGLAGQLYQKDDVIILQLRSNVRFGRKKIFVQQIANIFSVNIQSNSVLLIGSLPESFRSDYQIQSIRKNVYWTSKVKNESLLKCEQNGLIKSLSLLINEDEEVTDVLGEVGIIKNVLKSQKFTNANYLCIFSKGLIDNDAAVQLAKTISEVTGQKELGLVDPSILDK